MRVFSAVWDRCNAHEGYARLKAQFLAEQKAWEGEQIKAKKKMRRGDVKTDSESQDGA